MVFCARILRPTICCWIGIRSPVLDLLEYLLYQLRSILMSTGTHQASFQRYPVCKIVQNGFKILGEANYNHYEVSSYSKDGFECKHNYTYKINKPFYAFGLGSASYINRTRYLRPKKLKDYTNHVQDLEAGLVD